MSGGDGFLDELRKRGVVRAALLYAAAAFALLEFADIAFPRLGLPDDAVNWVLWIGIAGFPIAMVAAWAIELRAERDTGRTMRWLSPTTVGITAILIGMGAGMALLWGGADEARSPTDKRSVAVLPFQNMSQDANNEPFTIGIHDDLIAHISRISSIKTISRTSVLQYRETTKTIPQIARELGVATILEGGVQRAGDRVRINVQLIDAEADVHVWSETYDRQLTAANVFAIQSEIATSVAEALRATLSRDEQRRLEATPTHNLAAVEAYFLGKQLMERRNSESLFAAVEYFEQVIKLDPNYALGHSGLADATMLLPEYVPGLDSKQTREKSEAAANRALALDPDLPEVLSSMGWNRLVHYYDWEQAETLLRRALEIQSNNTNALHWLSHVLSWQGQHEEAIEMARRAVDVNPFSKLMSRNLSYILMDAGEFEASITLSEENLRRYPEAARDQYRDLWLTYLRAGRPEEGSVHVVEWAELTGRDKEAAREVGKAFVRYSRTAEPQVLPLELLDRVGFGSENLGQVYAFVGDGDRALSAMEQAYGERSGSRSVLSMKLNPGYDFIRKEPRFDALLEKVGLGP